jgi:hypothetical protein
VRGREGRWGARGGSAPDAASRARRGVRPREEPGRRWTRGRARSRDAAARGAARPLREERREAASEGPLREERRHGGERREGRGRERHRGGRGPAASCVVFFFFLLPT